MADMATIGNPSTEYRKENQAIGTGISSMDYSRLSEDNKKEYKLYIIYDEYSFNEDSKKWIKTGNKVPKSTTNHYDTEEQAAGQTVEGESTDWGAADIGKDDFINADGSQKTVEEIYTALDAKLPNITGDKLKLQIRDMMPKYAGVAPEERGFAREGFQKDVYGISKDAGKAGAQMQQAYGSGMGSQMRGAIAGQKDVAQQFKQAEQGYAQDIYGLEKAAGEEFEAGVSDWMQGSWFETPEGGTPLVTDYRQGGRVPSKKSFLDVLTAIPDAGGS